MHLDVLPKTMDFVRGVSSGCIFLSSEMRSSLVCRFPVSYVDTDVAFLVSSMRGTSFVSRSFAIGGIFGVVSVLGTVTLFCISSFTSSGEIFFFAAALLCFHRRRPWTAPAATNVPTARPEMNRQK